MIVTRASSGPLDSSAMDGKTALAALVRARDALVAANVRYFLSDGTLLGLVRHGTFIKWDSDIDLGVMAEDFNVRSFVRFMVLMHQKGFSLRYLSGRWRRNFAAGWVRKNIKIDLFFYSRRGDLRIAPAFDFGRFCEFSYPASLIETLLPAEFCGETVMAPKDKEAVVAHEYGDWQVPRPDFDWRTSCLNRSPFRRRPLIPRLWYYALRKAWNAIELVFRPPGDA